MKNWKKYKEIEKTTLGEIRKDKNKKKQLRMAARERYNSSDRQKKCAICDYNKYDVAHIKGLENFKEDEYGYEANDLDNLIALCKVCHAEFDHPECPRSRIKKQYKNYACYLTREDNKKVIIGSSI